MSAFKNPVECAASARRFFPKHPDGSFLRVRDLRQAISLREKMLTQTICARVRKELELNPESPAAPRLGLVEL